MAKLLIQTQVHENYGAHTWDGTGECPQYWKAKGGEDYVLPGVLADSGTWAAALSLQALVEALKPQVETNDQFYRETVIFWEVLADDALTPWEADQLELDGKVNYPAKTLTWPE